MCLSKRKNEVAHHSRDEFSSGLDGVANPVDDSHDDGHHRLDNDLLDELAHRAPPLLAGADLEKCFRVLTVLQCEAFRKSPK